jgi:hypothetical protein
VGRCLALGDRYERAERQAAGGAGFVTVKDGHLFAGEKRLRIFGVNTCFAASFPDKEMAPKVAARMAKFGINCVRFHHMDMFSAPMGILREGRAKRSTRATRPARLVHREVEGRTGFTRT